MAEKTWFGKWPRGGRAVRPGRASKGRVTPTLECLERRDTPAVSRPPGPQPLRRLPGPIEENQDADDNEPNAGAPVNLGPRPETPADLRRRLGQLLEADADDNANQPPPASAPSNPFGITTGAARPGVITPVPAPRTAPRPADPSTQP